MAITVTCSNCQHVATVPDDAAGARGKCERCGAVVQVPGSIEKWCCVCGVDVAHAKRTKDDQGHYYCAPCWVKKAKAQAGATPAPMASALLAEAQKLKHKAAPERIGKYKIVRMVGQGGMGAVYEALQDAPKRAVALKVIRPGLLTPKMLHRFAFEAEVLGKLQHPAIAAIYDAGTAETPAGDQPYFAMEFVNGERLTKYATSHNLSVKERLELLATLADAVHYAHTKGVIHRDLKPGNIMVAPPIAKGGSPQPKILDFGLARSTESDIQASIQTEVGAVLGTLPYMAPEQTGGNSKDIDARVDVYALGVIAYELLAGKLPLQLNPDAFYEALQAIREEEPSRLGSVNKTLGGDVEVIVAKALEKDKTRRYQDAAAFAADIRRHLHNEPITARPASGWYQAKKFATRHKTLVGGVAAVCLVLLLGVIGTSIGMLRAMEAERTQRTAVEAKLAALEDSKKQQELAAQAKTLANAALEDANKQKNLVGTESKRADQESTNAQLHLADGLVAQGDLFLLADRLDEALGVYDGAWSIFDKFHVSSFPAELGVWDCQRRGLIVSLHGHTDYVSRVAFAPDGQTALSGSGDKTLKLWDLATGKEIRTFTGHTGPVLSVAFAPDGRTALSGSDDQTLKLWDLASGKELHTFVGHQGRVMDVAFSPDGRTVHSCGADCTIRLWDVATGKELRTYIVAPGEHAVPHDVFWDGWGPEPAHFNPHLMVKSVAFSPDGQTALFGNSSNIIRLWDVTTGKELHTFTGYQGAICSLAFSPNGRTALFGSNGGTISLWDVTTDKELYTFTGHKSKVSGVAFSPDGRMALSGSDDQTLKLWDVASGKELHTFTGNQSEICSLAFSPDGRTALAGNGDKTLKLWNLATGEELHTFTGQHHPVCSVAFSPDGRMALSGSSDMTLKLWDVATRKELHTFAGHEGEVSCVAFSPDGRTALSGSYDKTLKLWDVTTGKELHTFLGHQREICSLAFSPDGGTVLSGSGDQTLKLWDVATGKELQTFTGNKGLVVGVTFSPDGQTALSCSFYGNIKPAGSLKLWDVATGRELRTFAGNHVVSVAFAPDGQTAFSGDVFGPMTIWDISSGKEVRTFAGNNGFVKSFAFSPFSPFSSDGQMALSCNSDGSLKLWDVVTGKELRTLTGLVGDQVLCSAFSPNGRALLLGSAVPLGSTGNPFKLLDFGRPAREREFRLLVAKAQEKLNSNPNDGPLLAVLGEWHAFRGDDKQAVENLEKARSGGTQVSALTLARCYWELGQTTEAAKEFQLAIDHKEAPEMYLRLCMVAAQATSPDTTGIAFQGLPAQNDQTPFISHDNSSAVTKKNLEQSKQIVSGDFSKAKDRFINSIGMVLVPIRPGTFTMGTPTDEFGRKNNESQHQVTLSKGFLMGIQPVTVGQFKAFVNATGYKSGIGVFLWKGNQWDWDPKPMWRAPGFIQTDDHPVVCINWNDAIAFCQWLSKRESRNYHLPTGTEWEYACRAGTTTAYYTGDGVAAMENAGWYEGNSGNQTHPVGQKQANAWGLYDMHGNVWQWCSDSCEVIADPLGTAKGQNCIIRGGAFDCPAVRCRSGLISGVPPNDRFLTIGFRLMLDLTAEEMRNMLNSAAAALVPQPVANPSAQVGITITPDIPPAKLLGLFDAAATGNEWTVQNDCITGAFGTERDSQMQMPLVRPFKAASVDFEFKMRAKWYHGVFLSVDEVSYLYSRGHWQNSASGLFISDPRSEQRLPGVVLSPDDWATLRVVLSDDAVTFYYNGGIVATAKRSNPGGVHMLKVGFASYRTKVEIKDVRLDVDHLGSIAVLKQAINSGGASVGAATAPVPVDIHTLPADPPKRFYYNYMNDPKQPSKFHLADGGNQWIEEDAGGGTKVYNLIGRDTLNDKAGTVVESKQKVRLFIPDKTTNGVDKIYLWYYDGAWHRLGVMRDVE